MVDVVRVAPVAAALSLLEVPDLMVAVAACTASPVAPEYDAFANPPTARVLAALTAARMQGAAACTLFAEDAAAAAATVVAALALEV